MPELSILMPVYNERATIEEAVARVLDADLPVDSRELVIVDDGSTDASRRIFRWPEAVAVVCHERNLGKGSAVRTALEHARGTYAAIHDADLEYDPSDIGRLLGPLTQGEAEVVYGIRGFQSHSAFSFWYVVGNKFVTLVANVLYDAWLTDIMTCHKAMPTALMRSLDLRSSGFELEGEITGAVLAAGHRVFEVPISYRARGRDEGKKLTGRDALRVIATLVRRRIRR
jgi:glycosyltransferase involved in cell wall biosynthesis